MASKNQVLEKLFFKLLPVQIMIFGMNSINSIVDGTIAGRYIDGKTVGVIGLLRLLAKRLQLAVVNGIDIEMLDFRIFGIKRLDDLRQIIQPNIRLISNKFQDFLRGESELFQLKELNVVQNLHPLEVQNGLRNVVNLVQRHNQRNLRTRILAHENHLVFNPVQFALNGVRTKQKGEMQQLRLAQRRTNLHAVAYVLQPAHFRQTILELHLLLMNYE